MFRITTISRHAARCILPAVRQRTLNHTTRNLRTASVPLYATACLRHRSIPGRIGRRTFASAAADAKAHDITVLPATDENGLTISDRAVKQLKYIAERDNDDEMLRILVDSGGCHGYQNKLELTKETEEDDTIFERDGVRVVVDSISLQFVRGSTVDFVEELIGSTFQVVDNPNAKNSCGCNISYDIDLDLLTQN
ncbi:hypothetical protein BCR43DRAFT_483756 [Syncephalastrum racemosum]|uniref:Core domain-containing protein n=1 Tax=Syncephalastrum racemosum TaxID=13706 RepID=A0A1X2HX57_SYNRA|nr:hypothetical protein BCR43DRAFT_483756 [Syncephalastrum racemosum]